MVSPREKIKKEIKVINICLTNPENSTNFDYIKWLMGRKDGLLWVLNEVI